MIPIIESGDKTSIGAFGITTIIGRQFTTYQGIDMMFSSNIEIVRESIGPHHRQTVTMTLIHFAHGVGRLRGKLILRCIGTVFGSAVADTVDRFKSQVFDGFNLHIYVGIERTILAVVIAIHHHVSIRITIVYIPVGVYRRIVVAISIINGNNRRCGESTAQVVIPDVSRTHASCVFPDKTHMFAHSHQSVPHLMFRVDAEVISFIIRNI